MLEELLENGYTRYINPIDAEVAAEYPCEKCGGHNRYGEGALKNGSYYVFAICPDCGHEAEF